MTRGVVLLLLARRPRPGRVKTRLARLIGDEGACAIHAAMAEDVWRAMRATNRPCHLATDDEAGWLEGGARLWRQQGDDLGQRLDHLLAGLTLAGERAVLFLAADTPQLGAAAIDEAASALAGAPLVTRRAADGGLVLLGLQLPSSLVMSGLPWETERLADSLHRRAVEQGVLPTELEPASYDIDSLEDLRRALEERDAERRFPATCAAARRALRPLRVPA